MPNSLRSTVADPRSPAPGDFAMTFTTVAAPSAYAGSAKARARSPGCSRTSAGWHGAVAADNRLARPLYRLSVRQGRGAVGDRHQGRRAGPVRRAAEFREDLERQHLPRRGVEHLPLHLRHDGLQARARPVAGAAAQPPFQGQGLHPRLHPVAVHHPDGAVDPGLEVDVRPDLQRDQLDAVPARHDPRPDQLARRPATWRWSR